MAATADNIIINEDGKLNMKKLNAFVGQEVDYFRDFLITHKVPDVIDDFNEDDYLLPSSGKKTNGVAAAATGASLDELQDRMSTMKNKMRQKKRPTTERAKAKREAKKLKNSKKFKKVLVSAAKSLKNESNKQNKTEDSVVNGNAEDAKTEIRRVKQKPIFNAEGKIVFSKFDFAAQPGMKAKKSHQNPREILKKMKDTDRKINELKEQGDEEKAAEIKNDLAWQKAFDKVEGKKVKDDPQLLYKAIKKRKVEKKKAKTKWAERKERVETDKDKRQKKRQDNLEKRSKDKKNRKLKKATKKGRVIPGF